MISTSAVFGTFRRLFQQHNAGRRRTVTPGRSRVVLEQLEARTLLTNPLTAIPQLNSLPGAPVSIYLDFDGHTETDPSWTNSGSRAVTTPVYDNDNDLTTFSDDELRRIEEIWYRVAEDFAPFNVNVTTVDPGSYNDFQSLLVSIGGAGGWYSTLNPVGGVALLNGFSSNTASNTVFVFTDNLQDASGRGAVIPTAMNASHEAGHALGLEHHSQYDANGTKLQEYDPGDARLGPIMGGAFYSERNTWTNGPGPVAVNQLQDDLAILTGPTNQTFAYRADDFGNTVATASLLDTSSPNVSASGIIERNDDIDLFRFDTNTGTISFSVSGLDLSQIYSTSGLNPGTNLDTVLRLFDAAGNELAVADLSTTLFATLSADVSAGTYYVGVSGTGEYGSLGQYDLTGTVIPLPTTPTLIGPTGTLSEPLPLFEWTVGANAAYYELEVDDLTRNTPGFYKRNVTGTSHLAEIQFAEGSYRVRVRTVAADGTMSAWSNELDFSIDVPAPTKPIMSRPIGEIGTSFPVFEWNTQASAAQYTLWVNDLNTGRRVIYRTNFQGTSYQHFDPLPDGTYRAWVQAVNSVNERSPWSDFVEFTIDAPTPGRPTITAPTTVTNSINPRIEWTYNDEAWKYDLWLNYRNTQTKPYLRNESITGGQYYDLQNLPQGTYDAWVRVINGNGEVGAWSPTYTFTVDVLPPDRPIVTGPAPAAGESVVTDLTPTFSWSTVDRAVAYDLWVNNETTGQVQLIRQTSLTDTSFTPLTNLPEGNYRVWVRGINSAGEVGFWSNPFAFRLDQPVPAVPTFTGPTANTAGSVETSTPTFTWTGDVNAASYELWIDDVTAGRSKVIYVTGLQATNYTVPNSLRLQENTYRAWVRAFNSAGDASLWSPVFTVRIDVPNPTTPSLLSPSGTIRTRTPKFEWVHSAGTVEYEILVRDLERQENIVLQVKSFTVSPDGTLGSYVLPADKALRNGTYRVWIRGFNTQGTASAWSGSQTFTVLASLESDRPAPVSQPADGLQLVALTTSDVEIDPALLVETESAVVPAAGAAADDAAAAAVVQLHGAPEGQQSPLAEQPEHAELTAFMEQFADPEFASELMTVSAAGSITDAGAVSERTAEDAGSAVARSAAMLSLLPFTRSGRRERGTHRNRQV